MSYFTTRDTFFVVPLDMSDGEIQKIEYLAYVLEKSDVGKVIENENFNYERQWQKYKNLVRPNFKE